MTYQQQLMYPFAKNWASNVEELKKLYLLPINDEIETMSKGEWKGLVKRTVRCKTHEILLEEASTKKKLDGVLYPKKLITQAYLKSYPTKIAQTIFKIRARSTNCLANRGSSDVCRLCGEDAENQEHVLNCCQIRKEGRVLTLSSIKNEVECECEDVTEIAERFLTFQDRIDGQPRGEEVEE